MRPVRAVPLKQSIAMPAVDTPRSNLPAAFLGSIGLSAMLTGLVESFKTKQAVSRLYFALVPGGFVELIMRQWMNGGRWHRA